MQKLTRSDSVSQGRSSYFSSYFSTLSLNGEIDKVRPHFICTGSKQNHNLLWQKRT